MVKLDKPKMQTLISTDILVIELDLRWWIGFPGGGFGQNKIIFGIDMSSSVHIDNKKRIF